MQAILLSHREGYLSNPSYSRGRDEDDCSLEAVLANVPESLSRKKCFSKENGWQVAQDEGPEPQEKKKERKKERKRKGYPRSLQSCYSDVISIFSHTLIDSVTNDCQLCQGYHFLLLKPQYYFIIRKTPLCNYHRNILYRTLVHKSFFFSEKTGRFLGVFCLFVFLLCRTYDLYHSYSALLG
jgi:hypothetical protein